MLCLMSIKLSVLVYKVALVWTFSEVLPDSNHWAIIGKE